MTPSFNGSGGTIEFALQNLQKERSICVARLTDLLEQSGSSRAVESCLARIDTINAAVIRLAAALMKH